MKALTTAIYNKLAGSALATAIGSRMYENVITAKKVVYPYVVYSVVVSNLDKLFNREHVVTLIQFSIFSLNMDASEIQDIHTALNALYDECVLTITGSTPVWMKEVGLQSMVEEHTTQNGTETALHYAVDYEVRTITT